MHYQIWWDLILTKRKIEAGVEGATTGLASSVNEINQASGWFSKSRKFWITRTSGFDLDNEQEQDSKEEAANLTLKIVGRTCWTKRSKK